MNIWYRRYKLFQRVKVLRQWMPAPAYCGGPELASGVVMPLADKCEIITTDRNVSRRTPDIMIGAGCELMAHGRLLD